jgi:CRISPR-associated protein Csb1
MNYAELYQAVQSTAGLRLRLRLQPLYGPGEIVFPPTYANGSYLISLRRIPGYPDAVPCAIMDSVQSAANRMEDALIEDMDDENIFLPHAVTDFSALNLPKPLGKLTSLDAPHRIFDAIIRDSELNGVRFPHTEVGKAVVAATTKNATGLFQYDPTSLLFGSWDSTGVSGGLGEKFTRCVVSEIVAINAIQAARGAARVDPLNASKGAYVIRNEKDKLEWRLAENDKQKGALRPSEINHGNIPPTINEFGGISCDYIRQTTTISFPALRQLRFPLSRGGNADCEARTVLAAIALHAAALNVEKGWHLRSRCDLVLEEGESPTWELIGETTCNKALKSEATRDLLEQAIDKAKEAGLPWETQAIKLVPSKSLADLVRKSQQLQREATEATD